MYSIQPCLDFSYQITHVDTTLIARMAEGWYFGVKDSKPKRVPVELPSFNRRGTHREKASSVQSDSNADALRDARNKDSAKEHLDTVQNNTKYSLFCLTFAYFRALSVIRKEKSAWDGSQDMISLRHGQPLSEERKRMIAEAENADFRTARIQDAMGKARAGEERHAKHLAEERQQKAKIRIWECKKRQNEQALANSVQRVFRGYLGRKAARQVAQEKARADFAEALVNDSATDIARVWRGYCGRLDAGYLRAEMAKFLFAIREEEVRDEEEEYLIKRKTVLL